MILTRNLSMADLRVKRLWRFRHLLNVCLLFIKIHLEPKSVAPHGFRWNQTGTGHFELERVRMSKIFASARGDEYTFEAGYRGWNGVTRSPIAFWQKFTTSKCWILLTEGSRFIKSRMPIFPSLSDREHYRLYAPICDFCISNRSTAIQELFPEDNSQTSRLL